MSTDRIQQLQRFLDEDPTDSFTRYALGLEYASRGDFAHAAAIFEQLTKDDPAYIPSYQQLGYLYQNMKRWEAAREIFRRGITAARAHNDLHAMSEMQQALDEMEE
jgi:tetratricopeptide (TPR) repeat protein